MESGNTENEPQNDQVRFDSRDIKRHPDYLTNVKKRFKWQDIKVFLFKGFHKFITIGTSIIIVGAILIFSVWLCSTTNDSATEPPQEDAWSESLNDIQQKAADLLNSGEDDSYAKALEYLNAQIKSAENSDQSFDIRMLRASILVNNGASRAVIDEFAGISETEELKLSDKQRYHLYLTLAFAYRQINDEDSAQKYDAKIEALPQDVTNIGG